MYEEILSEIGLGKSEIAVYFELLRLGSSTTGPIIKTASIASGKAYIVLDKLIQKGLVTYSIKAGIRYYQANNPDRLISYLDEKENSIIKKKEGLLKILPSLKADYEEKKYLSTAEVYEDVKGFKSLYDRALNELSLGDCIYVMGVPKEALIKFNQYLLEWNKYRLNKKVRMKILYNADCQEYGKSREKMKLTEVRYMPLELQTPVWIDIFLDYVATINIHGNPICFLIKNKESAVSYLNYFNFIWKKSKPTRT